MAAELLGCGIDAERVQRFSKLPGRERPWPLVFTPREVAHARSLPEPAEALCAAFCCKEALFKALPRPFNFTDCELLFDPVRPDQAPRLSPALCRELAVSHASVHVLRPAPGELAAVACVFGESPP